MRSSVFHETLLAIELQEPVKGAPVEEVPLGVWMNDIIKSVRSRVRNMSSQEREELGEFLKVVARYIPEH